MDKSKAKKNLLRPRIQDLVIRPRLSVRLHPLSAVFVSTFLIFGTTLLFISPSSSTSPGAPVPSTNIPPNPDFVVSGSCYGSPGAYSCTNPCVSDTLTWPVFTNNSACTDYVLSAINDARTVLNEVPMELPSNWFTLTQPEQLFVLADLERIGLGYAPYLGLNADLSAEAQSAAIAGDDPGIAVNFAIGIDSQGYQGIGGAWGDGFNALVADYYWLYSDGWGGSLDNTANIACTSATDPACWGHRLEILGDDPGYNPGVGLGCTTCEMGTGYTNSGPNSSWVDLIELPAGLPPAMTFTWASEIPFFDPAYLASTPTTTTTITTTTTTKTTTTKLAAPQSVSFKKLALTPNFVAVSWSSPGTQGVYRVFLWTYIGMGCKIQDAGPSKYYSPSLNTTSGTISLQYPGAWKNRKVVYSATVWVFSMGGSKQSSCASLGES